MIVGTPNQAAQLLAPIFAASEEEAVAVLHLGRDQRLIALTVEEPGSQDEVELPIRSMLANALRLGAQGLVIAHNHPSGDPDPRAEDQEATRALARAAASVNILLHDHLIFAGSESRSFRALGLL